MRHRRAPGGRPVGLDAEVVADRAAADLDGDLAGQLDGGGEHGVGLHGRSGLLARLLRRLLRGRVRQRGRRLGHVGLLGGRGRGGLLRIWPGGVVGPAQHLAEPDAEHAGYRLAHVAQDAPDPRHRDQSTTSRTEHRMQARRRRRLAAVVGVSAALVGLTACERPTPAVTLYSGDTSTYDEAFSYCFDGQDPSKQPGEAGACRFDSERVPDVLTVRPGDEVLVDVDEELTGNGWFVVLRGAGGQASRLAVQTEHVTSFQPDFSQSPTITVQVQRLSAPREDAQVTGVWQFTIVPG